MKPALHLVLLIFCCCLLLKPCAAQYFDPGSRETLAYHITAAEALFVLKHPLQPTDTSLFHNHLGAFHDLKDTTAWPAGHYLTVRAEGNQLKYSYLPLASWHLDILESNRSFAVQLIDKKTLQPLSGALLIAGSHTLSYDKNAHAYYGPLLKKETMLTVILAADTFYYELEKDRRMSYYDEQKHKSVLHWPVDYIAKPAIFLARLPVDGIRSWAGGRQRGTIEQLSKKLAHRRQRREARREDREDKDPDEWEMKKRYDSYFFFSKPAYREKDTIRFKAYVQNVKKRQWLDKPLWVCLQNNDDHYMARIRPLRAGDGYTFSFVIQDSMDIDLDDFYTIALKDEDSVSIARGKFLYEDYELKKAVFKMEIPEHDHINGKPFELTCSARDENDLPLQDVKATLYAIVNRVTAVLPDSLFIPDTLWHDQVALTDGACIVPIPDSIFPEANISYKLYVLLQNGAQERKDTSFFIDFRYRKDPLSIRLEQDSIRVSGPVNSPVPTRFYATDRFDNILSDTLVTLPFATPADPHAFRYHCETPDDDDELDMNDTDDSLAICAIRTRDSIFISLDNPRRLPVIYHLYQGSTEIARGIYRDAIRLAAPANEGYSCVMDYVWAGKTRARRRHLFQTPSVVTLSVSQPPLVYPGKETTITVTARDYQGRPVSDMNVLAYAFTGKFRDYQEPHLPYLGKPFHYPHIPPKMVVKGDEDDEEGRSNEHAGLNFRFWNRKMQLDTAWSYRFLYPQHNTPYTYSIPATDSKARLAPFVVGEGSIRPVQYVLIDNIPVYFGFTDIRTPYSFPLDTGRHQVIIRTANKRVTIDHVTASPYRKTILSVDEDMRSVDIRVENYPDTFTKEERAILSPLVMNLDVEAPYASYAYLSCYNLQDFVWPLSDIGGLKGRTAGPMVWTYWNYQSLYHFTVPFVYEPFYTYSFRDGLVKMKAADKERMMPVRTVAVKPSTGDNAFTEAMLREAYRYETDRQRMNGLPRSWNQPGEGKAELTIEIGKDNREKDPLNILLFKPDDFNFIQIYPGKQRKFSSLATGSYEIVLAYGRHMLRKQGLITLRDDGTNFYRITKTDTLNASKATKLDTLLRRMYEEEHEPPQQTIVQIMNAYVSAVYTGPIRTVTGSVRDQNGEPNAGTLIVITGTHIGTLSDADGNFTLEIPGAIQEPMLLISDIDGSSLSIAASSSFMNISIDRSSNPMLEDVMIYGQKIDAATYTGSRSTVTYSTIHLTATNIIHNLQKAAPGILMQPAGGDSAATISKVLVRGKGSYEAPGAPLIVIDGSVYNGGAALLDIDDIESVDVWKDSLAITLYGPRASEGVVLITIRKGARLPDNIRLGLEAAPPPMTEDLMVSSLRRNFRDDAYWRPDLRTGKDGTVSFTVKFPDDITSWKTYVFATDDQRHTGQYTGTVKAYKPVSASLLAPSFLLQGDSALALGTSVNYTPRQQSVTTAYSRNDTLVAEQKADLDKFRNDTLPVWTGIADSIRLKYMLRKEDGYFDGEEKTIPLLPRGIPVAIGGFKVLDGKEETFALPPFTGKDSCYFTATASLLDIVQEEIAHVRDYKYLCNEQLASKIIAALQQEKLSKLTGRDRSRKEQQYVEDMLDKLLERQNQQELWGWWQDGETVYWISAHALKALSEARDMHYRVPEIRWTEVLRPLLYKWEADTTYSDMESLQLMYQAGMKVDFEKYISRMERRKTSSLGCRLQLIRLRQQLQMPYRTDLLLSARREDVFGNSYWKDTAQQVYENEVLTTLTALQIIAADSSIPLNAQQVCGWLLQQRGPEGWRNTYESALIVEAIAGCIPLQDIQAQPPHLSLSGGMQAEVSRFPWQAAGLSSDTVRVRKQGALPVYFTWYRRQRDTAISASGNNFRLSTAFVSSKDTLSQLQAGEPVSLQVQVDVLKSASYVMIDVPIPAGCSYSSKDQPYDSRYEIHREHFPDHVSIFCSQLPQGRHTFSVKLLPRYQGRYTLNPARAELMYFPVFYGKEGLKTLYIK